MKTIDEQIEYMKAEVVEWSGIPDSGMGFPEDIEFRTLEWAFQRTLNSASPSLTALIPASPSLPPLKR